MKWKGWDGGQVYAGTFPHMKRSIYVFFEIILIARHIHGSDRDYPKVIQENKLSNNEFQNFADIFSEAMKILGTEAGAVQIGQ